MGTGSAILKLENYPLLARPDPREPQSLPFVSKTSPSLPKDYVKWVKKVNGRWLVHHHLSATTDAFLVELALRDPQRLEKACRIAYDLVREGAVAEDPKPRFYGGLFSLCTKEEADRYLSEHLFTALLQPGLKEEELQSGAIAAKLSEATFGKVRAIRARIQEKVGAL